MAGRIDFRGKRIAVIGLGPHGELVDDVKFLVKAGALVSVYDLRSEDRLRPHLAFLRTVGLANYLCGSIPPDDLLDMDTIILSHEYPRDSSFLAPVRESGRPIAIEYPETFFMKSAPPVMLIGIMGSCGKTTVMSLLTPMLEAACRDIESQQLYTIDPESSEGVIAHLKRIKNGDIVLARMTDLMIEECAAMRISPHVAIFTSMPTVIPGADQPFSILAHQTYNNFIIASDEVIDATRRYKFQPKAKMLRTKAGLVPSDWQFAGRGIHDRENVALALQAARLFRVNDDIARSVIERWKPLKGRQELIKKVKFIEFYNDSASVNPTSTEIALRSLSLNRNVVLILGGVHSGASYESLFRAIPQFVHTVVLLPGSGTLRIRHNLNQIEGIAVLSAPSMEEGVRMALEHAKKGDRVVFSPGFEAAGYDRSRRERGERFVRAVRAL